MESREYLAKQRENRREVARHESQHGCILTCGGIQVVSMHITAETSGKTIFEYPNPLEFGKLYRKDPHKARELTINLVAACVGPSLASAKEANAVDADLAATFINQWEFRSGKPGAPIRRQAELRATRWMAQHEKGIAALASQLFTAGTLEGVDLQQRLVKAFPQPKRVEKVVPRSKVYSTPSTTKKAPTDAWDTLPTDWRGGFGFGFGSRMYGLTA